jgi:hypothetical protein
MSIFTRDLKRLITWVVILFFSLESETYSQCKQQVVITRADEIEGIINGIDHYYQNLIIQDVALAGQRAFHDISLRLDYKIRFVTDACKSGLVEIKVLPVTTSCSPVIYQDYDVSKAVMPQTADLIFHLTHPDNFVSDSLFFFNIPVNTDSSLYTSMIFDRSDLAPEITVTFSRAIFHFTKTSYELFRDHILEIDHYYAASLIADSVKTWTTSGFLSEEGSGKELILRQIELERILKYISPWQFDPLFDHNGNELSVKYHELQRINNRLKAIIRYNHGIDNKTDAIFDKKIFTDHFLDWLDHYHRIAYTSDFRYVNFIDGLSMPAYSNADLARLYEKLTTGYIIPYRKIRSWGGFLGEGIIERAKTYEMEGDQLRALIYYRSAFHLARKLNLDSERAVAAIQSARMQDSIAASYLQISRKSALTGNPKMASEYFYQAKGLFGQEEIQSIAPGWIKDHEIWLLQNYENKVVRYIDLDNYSKALAYLFEIQSLCLSNESIPCTESFHEWMRIAREGVYRELLQQAKNLMLREEFQESGQKYRQAVAMRLRAGYRIEKHLDETYLELRFRQIQFEELYEEGLRFYEKEEFSTALYFLNKADYMAKSGLTHSRPELQTYRQFAARQVILLNLSEGRVKAWAYDFEGAGIILNMLVNLLHDYQVPESDSLTMQYVLLQENVRQKKCGRVLERYETLMLAADSAAENKNFILAYDLVRKAVNISMDNLVCQINDNEAWYQKALYEAPADYLKKELELMSIMHESCSAYMEAFQDLRSYYQRHKLLQYGLEFTPLFDRVLNSNDSAFQRCMLSYYIRIKDFNHAFALLPGLKSLHVLSSAIADEQKVIAVNFAGRDAQNPDIVKPWETLRSYAGNDRWYRPFRWSYKLSWWKSTHWKIKYWPFLWKK